jgi:Glyoxalase-like domain
MIVIDVPPAAGDAEVRFWQAATGRELSRNERFPEYHGARLSEHLGLLVQQLEDGEARVHLDIHTDDMDAEVARLEALGAVRVSQERLWWIMRDPAGLLFCVIPEPGGSLDDGNAQRWD